MGRALKLPWQRARREPQTEDRTYTDLITNALVQAASSPTANAYVSALEIAAGQLSRAFASAALDGRGTVAFTPAMLAATGRYLVERGEAVFGRFGDNLVEAVEYDLPRVGGAYRLTLPDGSQRVREPDRVFHAVWNRDPMTRRGLGPLATAQTLRTLLNRLEGALATEGNAAIGYLLPIPSDGQAGNVEALKADLANLEGRIAVVETARGGWGEGPAGAPRSDFTLARMGPHYPAGNVNLFERARDTVLAACGYPVSLIAGQDGTGQREGWRRYLHGTVAPLGRIVEAEAARIGLPVTLDFDALFASDIQGRARAFQSLIKGGMDIERAATVSGLISGD